LKIKPFLLTIAALFLLSSCSKQDNLEKTGNEIRNRYQPQVNISAIAEMRADYGDNIYDFTVKYDGTGMNGTLTVMEPETIAGSQVKIENGEVSALFDGSAVYMGDSETLGVSPACAVSTMLRAWQEGYMADFTVSKEDDINIITITYELADEIEVISSFYEDELIPIESELLYRGRAVVFCVFTDFAIK